MQQQCLFHKEKWQILLYFLSCNHFTGNRVLGKIIAFCIHLIRFSMLRLFTCFSCFFLLCPLLSCDKNTISPEDTAMLYTACGVKTPTEELAWLKNIISKAENGPDKSSNAGTVQVIHYQGQSYFVYQKYVMSCIACLVYDCQGNKLDILSKPELHMAIIEHMSEKNIIYRSPFH
jgi:hypothetical protein